MFVGSKERRFLICSEETEPHAVLLCQGSETNRTNVRWQPTACSSHEPSIGLLFAPDPLPVRHPAPRISARSVEITYLLISLQFVAHFQTPSHFSCHGSKAKLRKMCHSSSCREGATWCHSTASACKYIFYTSKGIGFKLNGNWLQRLLNIYEWIWKLKYEILLLVRGCVKPFINVMPLWLVIICVLYCVLN